MDLILKRVMFRKDGILGELTSDRGTFHCSTLEHAYSQNSHGYAPKLPTGLYTCVKGVHRLSNMKPFETYEVMKVPGHTGILFHQGNFNNDSEGCILLGEYDDSKPPPLPNKVLMISNSSNTFKSFMNLQFGIREFVLTVLDHTYSEIGFS